MIFRGSDGKLYEINKRDYLTEKDYNKAIISIKSESTRHNSVNIKKEIIDIIKTAMSK
jgi:hypothetical protein